MRRRPFAPLLPTLVLLMGLFVPIGSSQSALVFQKSFSVDLDRYMGVWHEFARTPNRFQDNTLQRDGGSYAECYNATAEYTRLNDRRFQITNRCLRDSAAGEVFREEITGIANIASGEAGRKFKIAFGSSGARLAQRVALNGGADYWVYCLGPLNADGVYDWAVTGGSKQRYAFFLTRNPFVSESVRQEMIACAADHGFDAGALVYKQRRPSV